MTNEIRGLAWDDKPEGYMNRLRRRLESLQIGLEVLDDHGEFLKRFEAEQFDFVVLDLFEENGSEFTELGTKLAKLVASATADKPWFPIFVITGQLERLRGDHFEALPAGALLRYKADPVFIARLIKEDLQHRGVYIERRKVFLVRAMNDPLADQLLSRLVSGPHSLTVETVEARNTAGELLTALRRKMAKCAAILAVCAKDDETGPIAPNLWRTRPNITLEIGIALSLYRGLERLIILKQNDVERPTDLGGLLTLNYATTPLELWPDLERRMALIGVDLTGGSNPQK